MRIGPSRRGYGLKMHSEQSDPAGRRQIIAGAPLALSAPRIGRIRTLKVLRPLPVRARPAHAIPRNTHFYLRFSSV